MDFKTSTQFPRARKSSQRDKKNIVKQQTSQSRKHYVDEEEEQHTEDGCFGGIFYVSNKVAKIRKRYNQVPHLTQDTNGKVTNSQKTAQTRAKRSALSQQVTTKHI